ncbi:MAG: anaerobic glycerol-3-phosphate dehydrogenase subunit GlpB [Anaerolineae bacterium]
MRPLYDPGGAGRDAKRTFTVLDHASDGIEGLVSVLGGKLTTYRLMAEKVSDVVCARLGVSAPCATATTVLPSVHEEKQALHHLRDRLGALEHGEKPGELICECEIVTRGQIVEALKAGGVVELNDLRRDLRLGMGPCQGGFCAYRAAGVRYETVRDTPEHTVALLSEFVERRFGGTKPLLWGHNLRQALLAEHIYGRILGFFPPSPRQPAVAIPSPTQAGRGVEASGVFAVSEQGRHTGLPLQNQPRIVVVGAGLAGLTAALACAEAGAKVELVAQGQGGLTLHPGWIETGDVERLAQQDEHPYSRAGGSLAAGLALLDAVIGLKPVVTGCVTALGSLRPVALSVGAAYPALTRVLIVGFDGWRDFYAGLVADNLRAAGVDAEAAVIDMPRLGGNFDNWTIDLARYLDTPAGLDGMIAQVKPKLGGAAQVGFPAVLGFQPETRAKIAEALGCPVFEIPTLTPSVPGLRLYHALRRAIIERGGRVTVAPRVTGLHVDGGRVAGVYAETAAHGRRRTIPADAVILATGGLFGGGLASDYQGRVVETVAGLPVAGVPPLAEWLAHPLLSGEPQPIHRAGIATDGDLRPLDADGNPVAPNLYAAGRLLAGYSPVVEGSTEGVDIATGAHAALKALAAIG